MRKENQTRGTELGKTEKEISFMSIYLLKWLFNSRWNEEKARMLWWFVNPHDRWQALKYFLCIVRKKLLCPLADKAETLNVLYWFWAVQTRAKSLGPDQVRLLFTTYQGHWQTPPGKVTLLATTLSLVGFLFQVISFSILQAVILNRVWRSIPTMRNFQKTVF